MTKPTVAIIGAGIVGATLAYRLSKEPVDLLIFDEGIGQASKAAAGIICPWFSQRRNKNWYHLTTQGAAYYPQLMNELTKDGVKELPYQQVGTLVFKKRKDQLEKLFSLAQERKINAPMMGQLEILSPKQISKKIPGWIGNQGALWASGGGHVDGAKLVATLLTEAQNNGATLIAKKATIQQLHPSIQVTCDEKTYSCDKLALTSGAWLGELLQPFDMQVDIQPQKGQLIELTLKDSLDNGPLPVCMLHGETDLLPITKNHVLIGATHENGKGFDLSPDPQLQENMRIEAESVWPLLQVATQTSYRIGTRAYTSDFSPFLGRIAEYPQLFVASGLGSSGLTSGPYIGHLLAQLIMNQSLDMNIEPYQPDPYIQLKK